MYNVIDFDKKAGRKIIIRNTFLSLYRSKRAKKYFRC